MASEPVPPPPPPPPSEPTEHQKLCGKFAGMSRGVYAAAILGDGGEVLASTVKESSKESQPVIAQYLQAGLAWAAGGARAVQPVQAGVGEELFTAAYYEDVNLLAAPLKRSTGVLVVERGVPLPALAERMKHDGARPGRVTSSVAMAGAFTAVHFLLAFLGLRDLVLFVVENRLAGITDEGLKFLTLFGYIIVGGVALVYLYLAFAVIASYGGLWVGRDRARSRLRWAAGLALGLSVVLLLIPNFTPVPTLTKLTDPLGLLAIASIAVCAAGIITTSGKAMRRYYGAGI